jgi:S1-C subfamily serine protease
MKTKTLALAPIHLTTALALAMAMAIAAAPAPAQADDFATKGRPIYQKHHETVVTLQLVIKNKLSMTGMAGQSTESRQEVTGTVVDPTGLTVVSLSTIDPGQLVENLGVGDRIKMESELADVKILMRDGSETPAEVVLRDRDLDLAFIRPKTPPAQPMPHLDLKDPGTADLLDPILALNRLGNAAGRAYSASAERIAAIVRRPRLFYVPDANMTTSSLGCPTFTMEGKVLGIFVMRAIKASGVSGSSLSSQNPNYTGIVLPAADVLRAANQVPPPGKAADQ